jgi:hypothetical protein
MESGTSATRGGRSSKAAKVGAVAALLSSLLAASPARADAARVAVLAPDGQPIAARLQRNLTSLGYQVANATITVCTRESVTRQLDELHADAALCADGDAVGVWTRDGERIVLKDAIVAQAADDRGHEVTAARAVMALREGLGKADGKAGSPGSLTIVANPSGSGTPSKDEWSAPPAAPPAKPSRIAPPLVLGAGPAMAASRDGTSFAVSVEGQIGLGRYVALVPSITFIPVNRVVERDEGSASFRPTLFAVGIGIPILRTSSFIVPRVGAGYGILWMHVAPESAAPPATMRAPEDLVAPVFYSTASLSFAVYKNLRVVAEGMGGVSSHDMIVRIARSSAAHWGVPLGGLALRGEWVIQ